MKYGRNSAFPALTAAFIPVTDEAVPFRGSGGFRTLPGTLTESPR